jgi:hypothetical protein
MEETAASGAAEPSPGAPALPQSLADLVEHWWEDHFPGSPVAQVTQVWNHAFAAKEELKRRLANLVLGGL